VHDPVLGLPEARQPMNLSVSCRPDAVWESRSGLEVLQAPIGHLLGLRVLAASEGAATFALPAQGWLSQPLGFVQRPVLPDGRELTASASIMHRGRSLAYTRADVVNEEGKIVAMATSTSLYR
jgi:acyl-coenzyme A thioesterase PaaI-like protein